MADLGTATGATIPSPIMPLADYLPVGLIDLNPTNPVPTWGQLWPRGDHAGTS